MSFYNAYENIHVVDKQYAEYSAYDANSFTPNLPVQHVQDMVVDEHAQYGNYETCNKYYNNGQPWRAMDGYFDPAGQANGMFATQQKTFATGENWQSKGQPYYPVSWDQVYPEETASPLSPYSQIVQQEFPRDDYPILYHGLTTITTTTTTLPVDINSSRSPSEAYAYGNGIGGSDNSELSLTPPHEYHSSGSDGGSDDIHSHLIPGRKPLQQQYQPRQYQHFTQLENNAHKGEIFSPTFAIDIDANVNGIGIGNETMNASTNGQLDQAQPHAPRHERHERTEKPSYYRSPMMKLASKTHGHMVGSTAAEAGPNVHKRQPSQAMPTTISVPKRRKACSSCRKRKIPCGTPMPGSNKCNQCSRNGVECDFGL